jgi:hypothetical protein
LEYITLSNGFWDQIGEIISEGGGVPAEKQAATSVFGGTDPGLDYLLEHAPRHLKQADNVDIKEQLAQSEKRLAELIENVVASAKEMNIPMEDVLPTCLNMITKLIGQVVGIEAQQVYALVFIAFGRHYPELADKILAQTDMVENEADGNSKTKGFIVYNLFKAFMNAWKQKYGDEVVPS